VWQHELDRMTIESEADSTLIWLMREFADEYGLSEPTIEHDFSHSLYDLTSPETPTTLLKEIYLTELYISSSGINLSQKAQEILRCQNLLFEHCGLIFPFEKICAVCDRPRHLRFDSQNRLHAEGEPAIEFADGWKIYFYHGVRLPEEYGQFHPNQWQSQWLLTEENAELRRVLIQGIGYDRIIKELSAKQIDSWQEYALLQIDHADVEPICLLKMTCPSTGFIHALRYNCGDRFLQVVSYRGQGFPSSIAAKLLLFFALNTKRLFPVTGMTCIDRADLPNVGSNPRLRLALNFANCRPGPYWFCGEAKIDARTIVGRAASRLYPNSTGSPGSRTIE
jgi:hypothetical protein